MGKTIVLALRRQENISSAFFFPKIDEDALMVNVHSTAIQIIIIAQKTEKKNYSILLQHSYKKAIHHTIGRNTKFTVKQNNTAAAVTCTSMS